MAARWLSDLVGTKLTNFKIKLGILDAAALTVPRTYTLPDKSGTVAMTSDISGAGGPTTGTVEITFGADTTMATATVSEAAIAADSVVRFSPAGPTSTHSQDEHIVEAYDLRVTSITPGVSFDVALIPRNNDPLDGSWKFNWAF